MSRGSKVIARKPEKVFPHHLLKFKSYSPGIKTKTQPSLAPMRKISCVAEKGHDFDSLPGQTVSCN